MYRLVVFAFKTLQEPGTCHPRSEEVAQVAVVVVVFPVVVLLMLSYNGRAVLAETEPHSEHGNGLVKK